jgi:acyl dehydratase
MSGDFNGVAPYFDDLTVGYVERSAPSVTLTDGLAALHQAILGDRLPLALDSVLAARVLDEPARLAHPSLVWDVAIGQSTILTRRVIANVFYRGLVLKRFPVIGDTLSTTTEVVALRQTTPRPGRHATGLAVLRVRTVDQQLRSILDFWRCALLPLRDRNGRTAYADAFDDTLTGLDPEALRAPISAWDLEALPSGGARIAELVPGTRWTSETGDVVTAAPELARLTLNVAAVHHDSYVSADGRRLVYGGHTIGLATAQVGRLLPQLVTIVGWHSCDHLAPVVEGDTLYTEAELERLERLPDRGGLAHLRARVQARRSPNPRELVDVLDWRFVALLV